jgi:hypothetical protein
MRFCSRQESDRSQEVGTNNQTGQVLVINEPTGLML